MRDINLSIKQVYSFSTSVWFEVRSLRSEFGIPKSGQKSNRFQTLY